MVKPTLIAALLCFILVAGDCLSVTEEQVTGTWIAKRDFMTLKLVLRDDHSLQWFVLSADDPDRSPVTGSWRVDQQHLFVRWELRDDWTKIPIFSVTRDTLVLDYPGRTTYRRPGCSRNLTEPTDHELIRIFGDHRDAFRKLQQMASEDVQNGWYFNWPNFNGSAPSQSRRQDYINLVSGIPQCFSVYTDYDGHIRFCFAEGSYHIWPPYPRWGKGIEFWPHACPWVILTNLDNAATLGANVYAREIEPQWFLFYQRDDD